MVGQKKEECFKKTLTKSDINAGLEITGGAANLPPGDEEMLVFDQNERVWRFKVGTRKDGRRFMKNQWLRFVEETDLNIGDTLTYYHLYDLRLFGANICKGEHQNMYLVEIERGFQF